MRTTLALLALLVAPGILFAQQAYRSGSTATTDRSRSASALKSVCDTTWLFQTEPVFPTGLATDGEGYWIGDGNLPQILRVDLDGEPISTLIVPSTYGSSGLYFDGVYLWAVVEDDGVLLKYDPTTGNVLANYTLPFQTSDNNHWGVTGEPGALWVSVYAAGGVTELLKVDPANGAVVDTVEIALPLVLGLIVLSGDLYGIDLGSQSILRLDRTTGDVLSTTPWCLSYPLGVAWSVETGLVGVSSTISNGGLQSVIRVENGPDAIADQAGAGPFHMYPVPASDLVTFDLPGVQMLNVRLMDGAGRVALVAHGSGERLVLSVAELRNGLYIAEVNDGRVSHRGRVLVAR